MKISDDTLTPKRLFINQDSIVFLVYNLMMNGSVKEGSLSTSIILEWSSKINLHLHNQNLSLSTWLFQHIECQLLLFHLQNDQKPELRILDGIAKNFDRKFTAVDMRRRQLHQDNEVVDHLFPFSGRNRFLIISRSKTIIFGF